MEKFFATIGKRDSTGELIELIELPVSETGYAIIDYQRERAYQNAMPHETIQKKIDKEETFNKPENIMAMVKEAVSRAK